MKKPVTPGKKVAAKKPAVKRAAPRPKATQHPLMVDGSAFDRQKVMDHVCNETVSSNKSVVKILAAGYQTGEKTWPLPDYSNFHRWMRGDKELRTQYEEAKMEQADFLGEELLEISDKELKTAVDVQAARLQSDNRKWLMSKMKPRKFGDKMALTDGDGKPLPSAQINPVFNLTLTPDTEE
ncbi:terminase small subunit-like protein [Herminiimonas contaminans]|uniref:Terminase small subunit n=1 Tax=Herminiimonas contaminans TaxID=1111140 RepID=A0ABS0EQU5_9BURK|nr:hypothetical protein [Herminiimonas contaminans]MBF8177235.1 hypothetical protein [Herminiimonas contaminans]